MLPISIPESLSDLPDHEPLRVAACAAEAAGRLIMGYYRRDIQSHGKAGEDAPYNLVTQADVAAEQLIANVIRAAFPHHQLLGEEELHGNVDAEHLWIIDPIDGTNNFAHGIPHFAVSIAYFQRGVAHCGIVFNPARGDWFWSQRGNGAWYNGERLQVNQHAALDQTIIACGFYYDRGEMMRATLKTIEHLFEQKIHGIRRMGTAALDFCGVAMGQFGAYFEYRLNVWDFAAAQLIVEEAGGTATTADGKPLPLHQTTVLVSNGRLHPTMLAEIRPFVAQACGASK